MARKEQWLLILTGLHLGVVLLGALGFPLWSLGPLGPVIEGYTGLSGAGSSYGFFAPEVGEGIRARFDLYDRSGRRFATDQLERGPTREADLRVGNIVESIPRYAEDDRTRARMLAAWSGKILARHRQATNVVVTVESIDVPTIDDYRKGVRYDWKGYLRSRFVRKEARP